jgi:glycosidase
LSCAVIADASPELKTTFDKKTGQWTGLYANGRNLISQSADDVSIYWNGGKLPPLTEWELVSIKQNGPASSVIRQAGNWMIRTEMNIKGHEIRRKVFFKWNGEDKARVVGASLTVPRLRMSRSPDDFYVMPSSFPVTRHKYSSLKPGTHLNESWWIHGEYCLAAVHSLKSKTSLIVGYTFQMDEAGISIDEYKESVDIAHRFNVSALVKPGDEIECGTQIIRFTTGDENRMRSEIADLSNSIGNGPPADWPVYLKKAVVYENHPWGRLETWSDLDRGERYPRLTSLMPYYQKLGVTTMWLLPVSWHPPWVYSLPEFDRIDPQNGSPEELKTLIDTAHSKDIKVLVDLVTYGIRPDSSEVAKLPADVWCYDEKGERIVVWGGSVLAADCSNPIWQKRIGEVASYWAKNFGFDGTRLDCVGWGQVENYNNPRMNAAVSYGGSQLNKVIRDSMRTYNKNAAELPEGAKPLVFKNADMVFGYPLYMKMRDMTSTPDLASWISSIKDWLEYERVCYPSRAVPGIVRFLENHDTVSAAEYFGVGTSQALMATQTFIQGIPMIHQEEETGFTQDLSAWLKLRRSEKCFYDGVASYTSIKCSSPYILAFLRKSSSDAAVVAINFTGADIDCSISWPKDLNSKFPDVYDAFSGKRHKTSGTLKVRIPAYRPKIVLLKPSGKLPVVKSYDIVDPAATLISTATEVSDSIEIKNAKRWFVKSGEGYLEDDFNTLNAKYMPNETITTVLPVLRRAWNPLSGGLMDGISSASLGVISESGKVTRVEFDPSLVTEAKIVDPAGDGKNAQIVVKHTNSARADASFVSKWAEITPQFVHLKTGHGIFSLARKHGGVPAGWTTDKLSSPSVFGLADTYTDWGIIPNRQLVSADGETSARMTITATDQSATVKFTGTLRARAWNTVSTCGIAGPITTYTLEYTVDGTGSVIIRIGIKSSVDIPAASAFYAMRIPIKSFESWKTVNGTDIAGDKTQGRLTESKTTGATAYEVTTASGKVSIDSYKSFQNVFLTTDGAVYLALLEGLPVDLKAGQELSGTVRIMLEK